MTHTPGPWFVKEISGIGMGIFGWRDTLAVPVAQVHSSFADVQEANAQLIAAAPELLAALQRAQVYIEDMAGGCECTESSTCVECQIYDALARARADSSEEVIQDA